MWGIPETHPVALAEISSSFCRGLTCSLSLKLALQVEGPSTFSITQKMFGESLLKTANIGLKTRKKRPYYKEPGYGRSSWTKAVTRSSTFALGIAGGGRSQEWMNKNVENSKLGFFANNRSKRTTRRSFHEMAIAHS